MLNADVIFKIVKKKVSFSSVFPYVLTFVNYKTKCVSKCSVEAKVFSLTENSFLFFLFHFFIFLFFEKQTINQHTPNYTLSMSSNTLLNSKYHYKRPNRKLFWFLYMNAIIKITYVHFKIKITNIKNQLSYWK